MNRSLSTAVVALFVVTGCSTGQGIEAASPSIGGPGQSPSPNATTNTKPTAAASPTASNVPGWFPDSPLQAGTYTVAPFAPPNGEGVCHAPPQAGCSETA